MKGVGEMLRRTGAFFLRRSFAGDKLYWNTFKEYMNSLMTAYHTGVEFFLEGTRSRSCKSLPPKIGLLSMALEPLFMGEIPDVTVVPVSIAYEKPLEEQLFVYELLGVPKPKESTRGLFKALSKLNENFGEIYFEFGKPISVKQHFGDDFQFKHALEPAHVQELDRDELAKVSSLAYDIVIQQQRGIVITAFNLVAFAFNYRKFKGQNVTLAALTQAAVELAELLTKLGALTQVINKSIIEATLRIHSNSISLSASGTVQLQDSKVDFRTVDTRKMKGYKLSPEIMSSSVPIFTLQLYINPLLHWLAPSAILLLILRASPRDRVKDVFLKYRPAGLKQEYSKLRRLFALEFVLHPQHDDYNEIWNQVKSLGLIDEEGRIVDSNRADVITSILAPFLMCYLRTAKAISEHESDSDFDEKTVLVKVQQHVERCLLERRKAIHPYSLSLDSISLAVQSLAANGCLGKLKRLVLTLFLI